MLCVRITNLVTLTALCLAGGCAHYEYDIVEPAALAGHIGTKDSTVVTVDPIRYEAKSQSNRLMLRIQNGTAEPLKLVGDDSFAVDPNGESHPLPSRTIAPNSSTTLTFPPIRPTFRQSGPSLGLGVGVGLGSASYRRGGYYGRRGFRGGSYLYDDSPRYFRLEDDGTTYWDWKGNGTDVKVRIAYSHGTESFHHEFTFRRVKR
jgi:hypothetical protein